MTTLKHIDQLGTVGPGDYTLAPGTYKLSAGLNLITPDVRLTLPESVLVDASPQINLRGKGVKISGGRWLSKSDTAAIKVYGESNAVIGCKFAGGGFVTARGAKGLIFDNNVSFDAFDGYGLFVEGWEGQPTRDLIVRNIKDARGSLKGGNGQTWLRCTEGLNGFIVEAVILTGDSRSTNFRWMAVDNGIIRRCYFADPNGKSYFGPMGEGDGGMNHGWVEDPARSGKWRPQRPNEKGYHDWPYDFALQQRKRLLSLESRNVKLEEVGFNVAPKINPSAIGYQFINCYTAPAPDGKRTPLVSPGQFERGVDYPPTDRSLPGDPPRRTVWDVKVGYTVAPTPPVVTPKPPIPAPIPQPAPSGLVLQAEAGTPGGDSKVSTQHAGSAGGYIDFGGKGSSLTVSGVLPAPATKMIVRYANGDAAARPLTVSVNRVKVGTLAIAPTGAWDKWGDESIVVALGVSPGPVIVELVATGEAGPNVDRVAILGGA